MDEAHQVPELAAQFFGEQFGSRGIDQLLADLPPLLLQNGFDPTGWRRLEQARDGALREALREGRWRLAFALAATRMTWGNDSRAFEHGRARR